MFALRVTALVLTLAWRYYKPFSSCSVKVQTAPRESCGKGKSVSFHCLRHLPSILHSST
jgi:hypothetical protein